MLFSAGAARVDGFDRSPEGIDLANRSHGRPGVSFSTADVAALPVASRCYDLYVSFETIEHVEDDEGMLEEAARVLAPGGTMICSTPNRDVMNPGTTINDGSFNPFHVREYSLQEYGNLLQRYFTDVEIFGQTFFTGWYCSLLRALAALRPGLGVRAHQVRKLVGLPFERRARHGPEGLRAGVLPEMLVAVCRTRR